MQNQRMFYSGGVSPRNDGSVTRIVLLSVFFFLGCVLGAFFGANFPARELDKLGLLGLSQGQNASVSGFFLFVWLHCFAVLLGSSYLGVFFLPLLTAIKGFIFSCASAVIISTSDSQGIIMAIIILGIPSLLSVPAYFAFADNGFFRSARLLSLLRGDNSSLARKSDHRFLIFIPVLVAGYYASIKLAPYLLSLLN